MIDDQAFLDALPVRVVVLDREGRVLRSNNPMDRPGDPWSGLPIYEKVIARILEEGGRLQRGRMCVQAWGSDGVLVILDTRTELHEMIHALRQPLTNIMGYSALLEHPSASPEQRTEAVAVVQRAAQEMTDLLAAASRDEP